MFSFSCLLFFAISLLQDPALCVPQGKDFLLLTSSVVMTLMTIQLGALITGTEAFLQSAAPDLAGPANDSPSGCGGCYLVADVAGEAKAQTQ